MVLPLPILRAVCALSVGVMLSPLAAEEGILHSPFIESVVPGERESEMPARLTGVVPLSRAQAVPSLALRVDERAPVFRAQHSADDAVVLPLLSRRPVNVLPVRTLSIPTPAALLGNPAHWHGRFRAAYGSNFDGRSMLYGNLQVTSGALFGIDAEVARREDEYRRLANRRFWAGDFNLVYRLKEIRYVIFRLGAGTNWLTDGTKERYGFNSTFGLDVRLKKPFYLSTSIDWGTLRSDTLLHWQVSGGLDFGRFELFVGYDFFQIGMTERKNVIAGAGLWY